MIYFGMVDYPEIRHRRRRAIMKMTKVKLDNIGAVDFLDALILRVQVQWDFFGKVKCDILYRLKAR